MVREPLGVVVTTAYSLDHVHTTVCDHVCSVLDSCTIGPLQASYFKQSYPGKGVPEEVLTELVSEAMEDQKATSVSSSEG